MKHNITQDKPASLSSRHESARHGDHHIAQASPADDVMVRYAHLQGLALLDAMVHEAFPNRIAVSSSFGTESAVLLSMVAQVAPNTPILFLNTGLLFAQTEQYQRSLQKHLKLTNVEIIKPDAEHLAQYDNDNTLHKSDGSLCCHLRKVLPLQRSLHNYDAWITGRKKFQGNARSKLLLIEHDGVHYKINPLANLSPQQLEAEFIKHGLPRHPLIGAGFTSLGCHPCTTLPSQGAGIRSGRWADQEKTECGIHNTPGKTPWAGDSI